MEQIIRTAKTRMDTGFFLVFTLSVLMFYKNNITDGKKLLNFKKKRSLHVLSKAGFCRLRPAIFTLLPGSGQNMPQNPHESSLFAFYAAEHIRTLTPKPAWTLGVVRTITQNTAVLMEQISNFLARTEMFHPTRTRVNESFLWFPKTPGFLCQT